MAKEETKKADTVETATAQPEMPAQDPNALSLGDLKNLSTILDVASQRGAFKAAEMANVGFIYNKLTAFLTKIESQGAQPGTAPVAPASAETKQG
jgi:hypothetical protein